MHSSNKGTMMGRNKDNDRLACYDRVCDLSRGMIRRRENRFWKKDQEING